MNWTSWLSRQSVRQTSVSSLRRPLKIESLEHREVPASLAGNVFTDANNDGLLSGSETALSGVTVSVSGGSLTTPQTTTTDSSGNYSLTGLAAGTYSLTAAAPSGTTAGISTAGAAGGTAGSNTITGITLTADQDATGYNFGEVASPASLSLTQTVNAVKVKPGGRVTITYVAKNTGAASVDDVAASVNLDSLTFVSASGSGYDSAAKTWDIGTLAAGQSATLTITATVPAKGVFLPASRLVSTSDAARTTLAATAASTGDTAFSTISASTGGVSMQSFLTSSYRANATVSTTRAPVFPDAPTSDDTDTPAAPTTPTVTFFNSTGDTQITNGSTTETTAVIKGVTSPNTSVTLVETSATTTSDSTGAYTFNAVPVAVGSNTYTVQAGTGTATSQTVGTLTGTSSTTAPVTPTVTFFNAAGDTQITSGSTSESTTVIKGMTTANTAVTLVETGATATSDLTGAYTFSAVPVATGSNSYTVKAGTGTATSQATGTLTGTGTTAAPLAPTVTFFNAAGDTQITSGTTTETTTVIKGVTSANTAVTLVETGATTTSDSTGNYTFSAVPVATGSNTYTVTAVIGTQTAQGTGTLAGATSTTAPTIPTVLFFNSAGDTAITGGSTTDETAVVIRGVTSPDTPVTLVETGDTTVSDENGAYEFLAVPVAEGANTYTIQAGEGTAISQASGTLAGAATGDAPATPTVAFYSAAGDTQLTAGTTTEGVTVIKGTTSPNASLTLVETGSTTVADENGEYSFSDIPVIVGSNTYTITADLDGTTSQATVTFTGTATEDTPTAPTIVFFDSVADGELTAGTTTEDSAVIKGVTDPNTPVTLVETAESTISNGSGEYSFVNVPLTVGANTFNVQATGVDGTTRQTTLTLTRTDPNATTAPTTPTVLFFDAAGTTALTAGSTTEATTVIRGVTSANTALILVETGATTTSDANGAYEFTGVPIVLGSNTFTVKASTGTATSQTAGSLVGGTTSTENSAPTISNQQAAVSLAAAGTAQTIDLAGKFTDADLASTKVKFTTSLGDLNIDLYDKEAPQTVANFLNYVTDGDYNNSIFHRSVENFVLQGGGFAFDDSGSAPTIENVPTDPAVKNEPDATNRSNEVGTLAMAKLGGNPDSATSQFFINLGDNSSNLDFQNGGFTVFGKLSGTADQTVADALAAIPVQDQGGVFGEIPMRNYNGNNFPDDTTLANYAAITSATIVSQPEVLTYAVVSNSNPTAVTATIVKNRLTLAAVAGQTGSATLTIRATDKAGLSVDMTFTATVA